MVFENYRLTHGDTPLYITLYWLRLLNISRKIQEGQNVQGNDKLTIDKEELTYTMQFDKSCSLLFYIQEVHLFILSILGNLDKTSWIYIQ